MKAALLAIQSFLTTQVKMPQHIGLQMDNSTAVAYVNKRGGTRSSTLERLSTERNMDNSTTPFGSTEGRCGLGFSSLQRTHGVDSGQGDLHTHIEYYTPQVDLFASRLNHQLPLYVPRHPDPGAMEVDAMTLHWNRWTSFIYAPVIMLPRILKKIREDQATCLLIAPNWPGQTWYPLLLEMLVNIPCPKRNTLCGEEIIIIIINLINLI
jgi:hypothetical protein